MFQTKVLFFRSIYVIHSIQITQKNTEHLARIAELTQKKYDLESDLNASTADAGITNSGTNMQRQVEERNRIVQLVKLQAREVDALKAEINMLKRKGGHVYTPAVPQNEQ